MVTYGLSPFPPNPQQNLLRTAVLGGLGELWGGGREPAEVKAVAMDESRIQRGEGGRGSSLRYVSGQASLGARSDEFLRVLQTGDLVVSIVNTKGQNHAGMWNTGDSPRTVT